MNPLFHTRVSIKHLPEEYERELIVRSKAGDKDATWELLMQYRGALQAAMRRVQMGAGRQLTPDQVEDLESNLTVSALEVIKDFDLERYQRLSYILPKRLMSAANVKLTALTIPRGVLARWFKIWRMSGYDLHSASVLAADHGMATSSFLAIAHALEFSGSEWVNMPYDASSKPVPDAETQRLVYQAMECLTIPERRVVELFFGFRGDPSSDLEVAEILGSTRVTVKTQRRRAILKMRKALTKEDSE